MNRLRTTLSLLALATLSVGSAMAASPRDAPEYHVTPPPETPEERRSRRALEMEAVLGRLVGRFGMERPWVFSEPAPPANAPRTMMDCVAIGAGKGVHCVLLMVLPQAVPPRPSRAPMVTGFTEYGLDPNASRIRLMKVDRGSAVRMEGRVIGNTLTMWGRCWNGPSCEIEQRMTVSADGEDLWIRDYWNWEPPRRDPRYFLRRLSQEEADAGNWSVEGARPAFPTKPGRPR